MGLFSFTTGVGVGVVVGVNVAARFRRVIAPTTYAKRAGETAATAMNRIADAYAAGREAQREREADLDATYLR